MPIIAPKFPTLTQELLGDRLDQFKAHVEKATTLYGTVDVEKLKTSIAATGDAGLQESLRAVLDAYQREQRVDYGPLTGGCGGRPGTIKTAPEQLMQGEVVNVMGALMAAKTEAGKLDKDGGKLIDETEIKAAINVPDLAGAFLRGAIRSSTAAYQAEKQKWDAAIGDAGARLDMRERTSQRIDAVVAHHAATTDGADALRWTYRNVLVTKPAGDLVNEARRARATLDMLASDAHNAETSLMRFLPFWDEANKKGHLSDTEVKALLRTKDLGSYTADKKGEVLGKVDGSWDEWVKGKDIELASQVPPGPGRTMRSHC